MLQKMRRRKNQKKTAMTPVPTRIASSMLPLSSEPECAEGGKCVCVWEGCTCGKHPFLWAPFVLRAGGRWVEGREGETRPSTATLAEELTQPLALHTLHR